MPNLINTDSAGNVFYNYITPVIKGEPGLIPSSFITNKYTSDSGTTAINFIFPAPGIETKTSGYRVRVNWNNGSRFGPNFLYTNNANGTTTAQILVAPPTVSSSNLFFAVANDYSLCLAIFSPTFAFHSFYYAGWLREQVYLSAVYPRGLVALLHWTGSNNAFRVASENGTTLTTLSTAADSITSPPIVCTTGTDPGDGSETFTDIVIRDAASPNNPVGKLWNCIDMPATCNVGELWRNTGAYDGDASASEQDIYLCVMPWGTRKLGMRVWTENIT